MDNVVEALFPTFASLLTVYLKLDAGIILESDAETFFLWLKILPALATAFVIGFILLIAFPFGHKSCGRPRQSYNAKTQNEFTADNGVELDGPNGEGVESDPAIIELPQMHNEVHCQPPENHAISDNHWNNQNHVNNHDKLDDEEIETNYKINKRLANGFVMVNPEFDDRHHVEYRSSSERSSNLQTDDDGVTMTISAETANVNNNYKPIITESEGRQLYESLALNPLNESLNHPPSENESLNPFPAYYDEVPQESIPLESIPPPKPLRAANSMKALPRPPSDSPAKNPWYIKPERGHQTLKPRPKPPPRPPSNQFEDELKLALRRVRTNSSISTNYRVPKADLNGPSPGTSSLNFDNELKKALTIRRSLVSSNRPQEVSQVDLQLRKTKESVSVASTSDDGTVTDSGDDQYSKGSNSVVSQPIPRRSKPRRPLLESDSRPLSETDVKVIAQFSETMERLKKRMSTEEVAKLRSSMSSIHKIVGNGSSSSDSERGKKSSSEAETKIQNTGDLSGILVEDTENKVGIGEVKINNGIEAETELINNGAEIEAEVEVEISEIEADAKTNDLTVSGPDVGIVTKSSDSSAEPVGKPNGTLDIIMHDLDDVMGEITSYTDAK
ncbi:uncharacterized protein LOC134824714 [Bolinopsis microptera]|uniref:uncharacterized protein LOC134824714 n=1 Tax=Bolinopsis microptera TaxID=2820187 RepID=UPI00307B0457